MNDITEHRRSGTLCRTSHDRPMIWNGHFCEGANLTPPSDDNFCLWTLCHKHDVPANAAVEGDVSDVTCIECINRNHVNPDFKATRITASRSSPP